MWCEYILQICFSFPYRKFKFIEPLMMFQAVALCDWSRESRDKNQKRPTDSPLA